MAFQQISIDAYLDGASLDQATLKDVEGNLDAARSARRRAVTWVADALHPVRMCGLSRVCIPFLHQLTPGTVELTVRVRHQAAAQTVGGCTLGIAVQSVESALGSSNAGYGMIFSDVETATITSAMTSKRTEDFIIDDTTIEPLSGWVVVWVTWTSDQGTPAPITNKSGTDAPSVLASFGSVGLTLTNPMDPYSETVLTEAVDVYDASASAQLVEPHQALRAHALTSGNISVYTWPPMPFAALDDTYDPAADYARRIPLGYTDIYSVQVIESDADGWPDHRPALDTGREASGPRTYQILYDRAEYMLRRQTRAYACGPSVSYTDDDPDLNPAEPLDRFTRSVELTTSWQILSRSMVGYDDLYVQDAGAGDVSYRRCLYRLAAMVWGHHYEREGQSRRVQLVDFRLVVRDPAEVASATTVTLETGLRFPTMPHKGYVGEGVYTSNPAAYLGGLFGYDLQPLTPSSGGAPLLAHALRSTWTQGKWQGVANAPLAGGDAGIRWVTGRVLAAMPRRALTLEVRLSGTGADIDGRTSYRGGRFMHCAAVGVVAEPVESLAETPIGLP